MLTRRKFAIGYGAFASGSLLCARVGIGDIAPFSTVPPYYRSANCLHFASVADPRKSNRRSETIQGAARLNR
jgi:hypothetical protein